MLEQLVESKDHFSDSRRRGGFLLTTFTGIFSLFTFALIYSLFSSNLAAMAGENLDISSLVSPVAVSADEPQPPEKTPEPKQRTAERAVDKLQSRVTNMLRADEIPPRVPTAFSVTPNTNLARPDEPFKIGREDSIESSSSRTQRNGRTSNGNNFASGIQPSKSSEKVEDDEERPPVKAPTPKVVVPQPPAIIKTSRVLNGQAIHLVKPPYPKMVNASGAVNVQVTIDENGNVTSASAVSGHPLLRQVSEQAARASKFSPTLLGTRKVKVTGVIVYNFIPK